MIRRRRRGRSEEAPPLQKRESSRLSPLVLSNPVNQSAHWSHEAYLLPDLVEKFELPQVVRCASRLVPGEEQHIPINVHVPMLLCQGRSVRKLLAKHVGNDARTHRLTETDDTIVIPNDYDGNFVRLQARTTQDKSVARTLADIARSQAPAFLNFSPLTSFSQQEVVTASQATSGAPSGVHTPDIYSQDAAEQSGKAVAGAAAALQNGKARGPAIVQQRLLHPPGSVFIVTSVTTGVVKTGRKTRNVPLLRCTDESGRNLVMPVNQPSEVVEVEVPVGGNNKLSQLPQELMATNRYPGLVRYVYGSSAPRLTPCSRLFTLIDTFEEESLIGCLLYPNHALMIELPMTSSLGFQVAMNHDEVFAMSLPRHALDVVTARKDTFVKDLKLKCKFLHRVNQGLLMAGSGMNSPGGVDDDMPSATVRTRQYANEAFFYL